MGIGFYQGLNQNREEERWGAWEAHRNEINELIHKSFRKDCSTGTAIILGAGNCDDLDLHFIGKLFDSIVLVDIDSEATEKAVSFLENENLVNQITVMKNIDFTKLDQVDFYDRFKHILARKTSVDEIISFLISCAIEIESHPLFPNLQKSFSVVISSAVYTQVFYIHALTIFANYAEFYSKKEVTQIVEALVELRNLILISYNNLLISLVKDQGTVIVWTDVLRLESSMDDMIEKLYLLRTDKDRFDYLFERMGHFGRESAVVGLQDLYTKLSRDHDLLRFWNWPYNKEKQYLTMGLSGMPKI